MAEWEHKVKKKSQVPSLTEAEITEPVEGEPTIIPPGTCYRTPYTIPSHINPAKKKKETSLSEASIIAWYWNQITRSVLILS